MAARRFSPKDKDEVQTIGLSRLLGSDTKSTFQWQVFAEDDQSNLDLDVDKLF